MPLLAIFIPTLIFVAGVVNLILWRKNLILLLIGLELLFLSANLGFILASLVIDDIVGYIFSMIIFAMAGVEVALGLALTIVIFRQYGNIYSESLTKLKI